MAEDVLVEKSKNRQEIENLLKQKGFVIEKISVLDMDSGEIHNFESYLKAMEFLKDRKGRWYITTPGSGDRPSRSADRLPYCRSQ